VVLIIPPRKKFLVTKPHINEYRTERYVKRQKFFKNCRTTEKEEEEEDIIKSKLKMAHRTSIDLP